MARNRPLLQRRMPGESRREWVVRNLTYSLASDILNVLHFALAVLAIFLYSAKNWLVWTTTKDVLWLKYLHLAMGSLYAADYTLRIYAADERVRYALTLLPLVEGATILPQLVDLLLDDAHYDTLVVSLKSLRPLRFLCTFRALGLIRSAKWRQICTLALGVVCIIVVFGSLFQAVEACPCTELNACGHAKTQPRHAQCQVLEIYTCMYFIVITISTLGYGDIAPRSSTGKALVIFLIGVSGAWLSLQISRLSDVLNRVSAYDRAYRAIPQANSHVLVLGDVSPSALECFLHMFFNATPTTWNTTVVVLAPGPPSRGLQRLLFHPRYEPRVVYLSGSPMLQADLHRASIMVASACYILTRTPLDDTATNFFTISLRHCNKNVPIFAQVVGTDYLEHVMLSGATNVVCMEQLKLGLLAKACVVPGILGLISSLLFTSPRLDRASTGTWAHDFAWGARYRIYQCGLPKFLDRLVPFATWAYICFREFHMLPIGVFDGDAHRLFPATAHVRWTWSIFVLATSPSVQSQVEDISLLMLQRYERLLPQFDKIVQAWNFRAFSTQFRRLTRRTSLVVPLPPKKTLSRASTKRSSVSTREEGNTNALPLGRRNAVVPHSIDTYVMSVACEGSTRVRPTLGPSVAVLDEGPKASAVGEGPKASAVSPAAAPASTKKHLVPMLSTMRVAGSHRRSMLPVQRLSHVQHIAAFQSFLGLRVPQNLCGHVVLCGAPSQLLDFVQPLRIPGQAAPAIVIVSPTPMAEALHARIATYGDIYHVQGSPHTIEVAHHAKVFAAKTIVLLASSENLEDDDSTGYVADTEALSLHRFLRQVCDLYGDPVGVPPSIVVEVQRPVSLQFLKDANDDSAPPIVHPDEADFLRPFCHPLYAAGDVFFSQMLDALLGACTVHGSAIDLVHLLVLGEQGVRGESGHASPLSQVPVPILFWGQTYDALFESFLLQHKTLCIGLYRLRPPKHYFVQLHPPPHVVLGPKDFVFVLK
ncbi:hypothetical protein SPRG_03210 [Saprolegnia parasitica CBS 223.65]|uniref:BK channel n=1 Tax=Saprolegnia parasitica (strain CBS 223.65) TaxID=695850 RepID=A0A067CMR9_SAPPC|nr:hypothetical protein SPRG_03210 [Saprolegnia parasitica CBS 223.65]KDO31994.1 hypothetical protein SPRG_03210 [Saprolegnia parasitica CBS 223.65]|eukprot:XP_012197189.1 hypothetical protein SPRG_03210 [Saprolegnia parasitica CBS 223.65]